MRLALLDLIGAATDEARLGFRALDVSELQELIRCWFLLAGEDTPAERVLAGLNDHTE